MYVRVCYQDKHDKDIFSMQSYAYRTLLPLKVNDLVLAPTKHGERVAKVHEVDVRGSSLFTRYEMRFISEYLEVSQ